VILALKLNVYEVAFMNQIESIRDEELRTLFKDDFWISVIASLNRVVSVAPAVVSFSLLIGWALG
jgi:hypothetical protein